MIFGVHSNLPGCDRDHVDPAPIGPSEMKMPETSLVEKLWHCATSYDRPKAVAGLFRELTCAVFEA
jgi:hypothetical protein